LDAGTYLQFSCAVQTMSQLSCSFACHCDSNCDISSRRCQGGNELLPLSSCARDRSSHLRQISVAHTRVSSEKELILARVGLFDEASLDFTICPRHRDQLGVKFRASIKCQHPLHGNRKGKRERGINLRISKEIKRKWNVVVPVGAGNTLCLFIPRIAITVLFVSTNYGLSLFERVVKIKPININN